MCIILTGNYNFFNLLTMALCISLIDDSALFGSKKRRGFQTYHIIHLSTNPSIHPAIHDSSIHPSTHPSTHPPPSIHFLVPLDWTRKLTKFVFRKFGYFVHGTIRLMIFVAVLVGITVVSVYLFDLKIQDYKILSKTCKKLDISISHCYPSFKPYMYICQPFTNLHPSIRSSIHLSIPPSILICNVYIFWSSLLIIKYYLLTSLAFSVEDLSVALSYAVPAGVLLGGLSLLLELIYGLWEWVHT